MSDYITVDQFKDTTTLTGFSDADADITAAITAASRAIDNLCNRRFYPDADANQVRYYNPDKTRWLDIDDLVTFTSLQTDEDGTFTYPDSWVENTDFLLEPLNAAADSEPFTSIRVHPNGNFTFQPWLPRSVKLTAKFGWSAAPDAIIEATTVLTGRLVKTAREAQFGVFTFGDQAFQIARNDPTVSMLIGPYRRHRFAVA